MTIKKLLEGDTEELRQQKKVKPPTVEVKDKVSVKKYVPIIKKNLKKLKPKSSYIKIYSLRRTRGWVKIGKKPPKINLPTEDEAAEDTKISLETFSTWRKEEMTPDLEYPKRKKM